MPALAILASFACTTPNGPVPPPVLPVSSDTGTTVDTAPTLDTASTDPTAGWEALSASVIVEGLPGQAISHQVDVVDDGDAALLAIAGYVEAHEAIGLPATVLIGGGLAPGRHLITDVWDGVSGLDQGFEPRFLHGAGDVDSDGHDDLWWWDELHLGPLLGDLHEVGSAHAWFEGEGPVVAAGLDANQDGAADVVLYPSAQTALVYFGPFDAGLHGGWLAGTADPSGWVRLGGDGCHDQQVAVVLTDHLGPGHPALAVGESSECDLDTHVFDLDQPAGSGVDLADSLHATDGGRPQNTQTAAYDDAGDLDGDGHPDVVYSKSAGLSFVLAGPLTGGLTADPETHPQALEVSDRAPLLAVGDINGDGVQELVGRFAPDGDLDRAWWVLMVSPHSGLLELSEGLPLAPIGALRDLGALHADLDGDGRSDLVNAHDTRTDADPYDLRGEVQIWYGRDLLDAWEALRTAL